MNGGRPQLLGVGGHCLKQKGRKLQLLRAQPRAHQRLFPGAATYPSRDPPFPRALGSASVVLLPQATAWLAARSPGGPQAYLKCNSSSLKECGATVGFRHLCGLGEGLAFWSPQMPPGHDCPPTLEAVPGVSHIKLSGHRAIDRTEKRVQSDVLI